MRTFLEEQKRPIRVLTVFLIIVGTIIMRKVSWTEKVSTSNGYQTQSFTLTTRYDPTPQQIQWLVDDVE